MFIVTQGGTQVKRYILKKMITAFFIVLVVIVINFLIIKLAPGDPVRILAGADTVTEDMIEALTIEFGLDQPLHVQLWKYIVNLFHGDLGDSFVGLSNILDREGGENLSGSSPMKRTHGTGVAPTLVGS